jgi:hypothetical protein
MRSSGMLRARTFLGLVTAVAFAPSLAFAQVSDAAMAESLFREGKRLMAENKPAEACPKFAESFRLDAGLGTLLNLASCHESEGKLASAWARFTEAETRSRREGDKARADFAAARGRSLEPRLSRLQIVLGPGASTEGLDIALDERHLSSAAFGLPMPVDPGTHHVTATAPGKKPWSADIATPPEGQTLSVTIPALEAAAESPAAGVAPTAPAPVPAPTGPGASPPPPSVLPARPEEATPSRITTPFIVSAAAAGAFAIGAVVTGVLYTGAQSDFDEANEEGAKDRFTKRDSAQTLGVANLVCTGGAVLAAGAAVVFFALGGSSSDDAPRAGALRLAPAVGWKAAGLTLTGSL